jgi:hypothetical protein
VAAVLLPLVIGEKRARELILTGTALHQHRARPTPGCRTDRSASR